MNNENIKKDNRKALPKFLMIGLIFMVLGAVVGGGSRCMVSLYEHDMRNFLEQLQFLLYRITPWGILVLLLLAIVPAFLFYNQGKKIFAIWDGEEEEQAEKIDEKCNWALAILGTGSLISMLFLSMGMIYRNQDEGLLIVLVEFIVFNILAVILQQKLVDFTRKMNPEKQGSIYDPKFRKKWMESCDEAEQRQIGQASYTAFHVLNTVARWLWFLLIISHMMFNTGLLPIFVVLFLMIISNVSYQVKATRLSKKKGV